ncbi:transcriptional regulator [Pararcticibacter amylolyticus]|uniref:Transcriptional regulator n=2 Tax=Pararcticibacter amylolyticus TaxID=2173175 RepID=A0A2U2PGF2_9SPHI|nr:transcriptional regulator [Pararcticibacter amylolyticus]
MKKSNTQCNLDKCFMCTLAVKEWQPVLNACRRNFSLKKGECVINEGDPVTGVYFVYSGKVKVHKKWGDKELIVRFATEGAIIGHRGLGTRSGFYPVSATALEPTVVCFIELELFLATLKVNHDFAFHLLMFFADELQESEKRMRDLALMPVKNRLATSLLQLKQLFGTDKDGNINAELSRQDIASFSGATYETVFRMMNELSHENLIVVSGKKIGIPDEPKLRLLTADHLDKQ